MPSSGVNLESANPIQRSYRRFLIDVHIPDWDPSFLSEFSPEHLAQSVSDACATVITVPANNHAGLNFWPSQVGRAHRAANGRDLLAEMLAAARRHELSTVIYYCIAYVGWYWEEHAEARIVYADGTPRRLRIPTAGHADRFSVCCHNNSGYREFVLQQVTELACGYDCDGFNIDMTMWPGPCFCTSCRDRFRREEGRELPVVVDWADATWRAFARRRAEWLAEFAGQIDEAVMAIRPDATLVHQSGAYTHDWWTGACDDLAAHTDWLSADLYQARDELSLSLKLFNALSERKPAELINAWTAPNIFEHVIPRTRYEMEAVANLAVAHDCALSVIDAVNPDGTISDPSYMEMTPIFEHIRSLEPVLGGEMRHDVAIYHSFTAAFSASESGCKVADLGYPSERSAPSSVHDSHRQASAAAGAALRAAHLPFGVATRKDLPDLDRWQVLILSNVQLLDDDECEAVTGYVQRGGSLYLSGATPTRAGNGANGSFLLGHLLRLRPVGFTADQVTYAAPTDISLDTFAPFTAHRPLTVHGPQQIVEVINHEATSVLATITLPYTPPGTAHYASILTDPPGRRTEFPSIIEAQFGAGRVIYAAGVMEAEPHPTQQDVFARLVRRLLTREPAFTARGPRCIEITAFSRPDLNALVLYVINTQREPEPLVAHDITITVNTGGTQVSDVVAVSSEIALPWKMLDAQLQISLPECATMQVIRVDLA